MRRALLLSLIILFGGSLAPAAVINVGASSDDWGDPNVGLSGFPPDVFLRVFGYTGNPSTPYRRGALEFDISAIPSGSIITSANLFLAPRGTVIDTEMQLHGYAGDGLVQLADLNDAALLSLFASDTPNINIDVTSFIQSLVDGSASFSGFMLRPTNEGPSVFNGADFASSEYGVPSDRPLLTVTFEEAEATIPEPSSIALLGASAVGLITARRRKKQQQAT